VSAAILTLVLCCICTLTVTILIGFPPKTTNTRVLSAQAVSSAQHQLTPTCAVCVPHVSAPVYQEDGCSRVGAQGHVSSQPGTPISNTLNIFRV